MKTLFVNVSAWSGARGWGRAAGFAQTLTDGSLPVWIIFSQLRYAPMTGGIGGSAAARDQI